VARTAREPLVKDRSKDTTQPTRRGPSGRGGSNIRKGKKEKEYIRVTKARLGDEQALRDHAMRHRPNSANPCTPKEPCDQHIRWQLLEWLKFHEVAALFGPELRELHADTSEQVSAIARSATITTFNGPKPRASDGDAVQLVRDYLANQREINELLKALVLALDASNAFHKLLVERPLHQFRELATGFLGILGYSYQYIAYLVDLGDSDRTRKSAAYRAVVDQRKEWAKCPPKKRRVQRDQGGQPAAATNMEEPETQPVATAARAELTAATKRKPAGGAPRARAPKRRWSERRVEQVKHLVGEPVLDQKLDGGARNV
jgi:hypothetical protein